MAVAAAPEQTKNAPWGVIALVVGIVAFLLGLIPVLGFLLGAGAVVFGVLALRAAQSKGQSVTGIVLGSIAVVASLGMTLGFAAAGTAISTRPVAAVSSTPAPEPSTAAPSPTATPTAIPTPSVTPTPTATPTQAPPPAAPAVPPEYTSALNKAASYSRLMHMSKAGIYDQLTSEYGEQFSAEAAQYAVDNVQADWNANALAKAKDYQSQMSMSPEAIRDQLTSEYGEKFTQAEADYAIQHLND